MKVTIVQNGVLSIVLQPETEIEKLQLKEVFGGSVQVQMHEKLQVLDKALCDVAVITPAPQQTTKPTEL